MAMRAVKLYLAFAACAIGSGCASAERLSGAEYDPWESWNRGVYQFNDSLDRVTLKPIAQGYDAITPGFVNTGVSNFFDNLKSPRSVLNNFLQGKGGRGFSELGRFLINSSIGIGGLLDVADSMGIESAEEDFGQTFAVWGMNDGPYVMLPFFGPSTLRDTIGLPFDFLTDPLFWYDNSSVRDKLAVVRLVDTRYRLLSAEELIADSKDRYISLRESYLQNREFKVYDGEPPEDDDFYDEFLDEE